MITLVLPYYRNPLMLRRHLEEWNSYAPEVKKHFRAVIVDDGSPTEQAIDQMREVGFPIELYRIKENIPLNLPGARNLGMKMAPDGWALLADIDHLLEAEQATELSLYEFHKGFCHTFNRKWADGRPLNPHPNSYLLERSLYWTVGGTDEDFSGYWGAGEQSFRKILMKYAAEHWHFDTIYLTHFGRDDIPDASTREWGRRGSEWDYNNNPVLKAKARGPAYKPVNPLRFSWEKQWPR